MAFELFKSEIDTGQPQQALFNSGIAKLERIDTLKRNIHKARVEADVEAFERLILCFHSELIEWINKDNKQADQTKKHFIKIEQARAETIKDKKQNIINNSHELALNKLLLYLNQIENKHGLGMTTKSNILDEL